MRLFRQPVDFGAELVAVDNGLLELGLRNSRLNSHFLQDVVTGNVFVVLEVGGKEAVKSLALSLLAMLLGQLH